MFVSGHLQLIHTYHFQILDPLDLNQIWQEFEFWKKMSKFDLIQMVNLFEMWVLI